MNMSVTDLEHAAGMRVQREVEVDLDAPTFEQGGVRRGTDYSDAMRYLLLRIRRLEMVAQRVDPDAWAAAEAQLRLEGIK